MKKLLFLLFFPAVLPAQEGPGIFTVFDFVEESGIGPLSRNDTLLSRHGVRSLRAFYFNAPFSDTLMKNVRDDSTCTHCNTFYYAKSGKWDLQYYNQFGNPGMRRYQMLHGVAGKDSVMYSNRFEPGNGKAIRYTGDTYWPITYRDNGLTRVTRWYNGSSAADTVGETPYVIFTHYYDKTGRLKAETVWHWTQPKIIDSTSYGVRSGNTATTKRYYGGQLWTTTTTVYANNRPVKVTRTFKDSPKTVVKTFSYNAQGQLVKIHMTFTENFYPSLAGTYVDMTFTYNEKGLPSVIAVSSLEETGTAVIRYDYF